MKRKKGDPSRYLGLYRLAPSERSPEGWPMCVYCGSPAESLDHVPPKTRVDDYRSLGVRQESYLIVKACKSCNELLGSTLQTDILQRMDTLKDRLRKKLGRNDTGYLWADDDLDELGPSLRSHVASRVRKTDDLRRRIDYRGGLRMILGYLQDTK